MSDDTVGGSSRGTRLDDEPLQLLFGDLHNHTLLSDGAGDPRDAFAMMRAAGLDFAALTDHASIPRHALETVIDAAAYPDDQARALARLAPHSLDDEGWLLTGELADEADEPGVFTAFRGFEWTEPWLGHANVWFSEQFQHVHTPARIDGLHGWLAAQAPEALFGYNHPGREPGLFADYAFDPVVAPRMVSLEVFNRYSDFLFEGWLGGKHSSPIAACLDSGWRPSLVGCSDEHGRSYGLIGKGRTGLWATEHSRQGVREALLARRSYATREVGLRLDATLGDVRMGSSLTGGTRQQLLVDLETTDRQSDEIVQLQLLGPAGDESAPTVIALADAKMGAVTDIDVDLPDEGWVLLRVAQPSRGNDNPGPDGHPGNSYAIAYASPWWLDTRVR